MRRLSVLTVLLIMLTASPASAQPRDQRCASRPFSGWRTVTVSIWRGWLPEQYTFTRQQWRRVDRSQFGRYPTLTFCTRAPKVHRFSTAASAAG